ncbi:vWA domain-containing protein [Microbacterium luticocti]|uniref:vWA domain-containing protein n=1 Tax=Microbacterium luticocti TaxID=451764 RepID=UPI0004228DF1|nr:vWA domain-containing protein [Microbacterium luticocti]
MRGGIASIAVTALLIGGGTSAAIALDDGTPPTAPSIPIHPQPAPPATDPAPAEAERPAAPEQPAAPGQPAEVGETDTDAETPDAGGPTGGAALATPTPSKAPAARPAAKPATITVHTQVLRNSTEHLQGATFRLHDDTHGAPGAAVTDSWATCTVGTGARSCDITVPADHVNRTYWVVEDKAAAGTYALGEIATGGATGNLTAKPYPGSAGKVASGAHISVPRTSGVGTDLAGIGTTVNGLVNPTVAPTCSGGLTVGLVLDLSSSIDATEARSYAAAIKALVNALAHQQGQISIDTITFHSTATAQPNLSGPASSALANRLSDYLLNTHNYAAATNWDAALQLASERHNDVVLMVTDGAPTASRSHAADSVRVMHVENAVLSANAVKNAGMPVLAVGVALPKGSDTNLQAISGKRDGEDYFIAEWEQLETKLAKIALGLTCQVPLSVDKTEVSALGTERPLAGGWHFDATRSGDGTLSAAPGSDGTTPAGGSATWIQRFTEEGQRATVTFTETPKDGWVFDSVVCTGATPTHEPGTNTWTVGVGLHDAVDCTVRNRESRAADITVDKTWVIDGTAYDEGAQPDGFSAQLKLTGPAGTGATDQPWGKPRTGYLVGQSTTLSEQVTLPGGRQCTASAGTITELNGKPVNLPVGSVQLTQTHTTVSVTNTVTCDQRLTLVKKVDGSADPRLWTLTATPPGGTGGAGLSGTTGVTGPVVSGIRYTLAESGGPATYVPAADRPWMCVDDRTQGVVPVDGAHTVTLQPGQNVTCTVTNTTARLTLLKHVAGTGLQPEWFELTGTPAAMGGLTAATVTGADLTPGAGVDLSAQTVEVRPDWEYRLSEQLGAAASGADVPYLQTRLQRWDGAAWVDVTDATVRVAPGEHAVYRFVNEAVPAVTLPLTGGTGSLLFVVLGGGGLAIALALLAVQRRRARRDAQ